MSKTINFCVALSLLALLVSSCNSTTQMEESTNSEVVNSKYSIASSEYEDLVAQALGHIEKFEFSELGEMVTDDIEYYLPDGGEESRTRFMGKEEFLNFWNTYQEKTGLTNWVVSNIVSVPVQIHNKLVYSNVDGIVVTNYFSLHTVFGEEETDIRCNWAFHFDENKKIDKIYSYYDRTPLIAAAKMNVLKTK